MRVLGLGFRPEEGLDGVDPESLFICEELCTGGSLKDVMLRQAEDTTKVQCFAEAPKRPNACSTLMTRTSLGRCFLGPWCQRIIMKVM